MLILVLNQTTILFLSRLYHCDDEKGSYGLKDNDAYSIETTLHNYALPQKEKDPGSFTLPCYINNVYFKKAPADLGACNHETSQRYCRKRTNRNRRNQGDNLKPTIEEGEIDYVTMARVDKARCNDEIINRLDEYPSYFDLVEDMDYYRDDGMGDVIVGKPFCKEVRVKTKRFEGMTTVSNGNDSVTYQTVRSHPRFKHLTNAQCNKIPPLLKISEQDKMNGILHSYQKLKGFYKGILDLGPEFIRDEKIMERITRRHISVHEME
nr:homeodomain-like protein [Tanacetum cinerariifolium]